MCGDVSADSASQLSGQWCEWLLDSTASDLILVVIVSTMKKNTLLRGASFHLAYQYWRAYIGSVSYGYVGGYSSAGSLILDRIFHQANGLAHESDKSSMLAQGA